MRRLKDASPPPSWSRVRAALLFAAACILILGSGLIVYRRAAHQAEARELHGLAQAVAAKRDDIEAWFRERAGDLEVNASRPLFRQALEGPPGPLRQEVQSSLDRLAAAYGYCGVFLLDANGRTVMAASGSTCGEPAPPAGDGIGWVITRDARGRENVLLRLAGGILGRPRGGEAPPARLGTLLLVVEARSHFTRDLLYDPRHRWASLEFALALPERDQVVILTDLLQRPAEPDLMRRPQADRELLSVRAVAQGEGIVQGRDYRGVAVVGASSRLRHVPWMLLAKVDRADMIRPQRNLALATLAVAGTLMVLAGLVLRGWWKRERARRLAERQEDLAERKAALEALDESEDRFRAVFQWACVGMVDCTPEGRYQRVNPAFEALVGYTDEELRGRHFLEITWPADREAERARLAACVRGETPRYEGEKRYLRKDGEVVWVRSQAALVRNAQGKPLRFIGVVEDITGRKQAEAELQESHDRFELAARSAHLAVWAWDIAADRLQWDDRMFELYGISREGFTDIYQGWVQRLHPGDRDRVQREIQDVLEGCCDYDTEFRILLPGGALRTLKAKGMLVRDAGGAPRRLVGLNWDITEQKQAEELLRRSERFLREAQHVGRVGCYDLDLATGRWESSPMLDEIFGLGPGQSRDLAEWEAVLAPEFREEMDRYLETVIATRGRFDRDYRILRRCDGQERWVLGQGVVEVDAAGRPVRMLGTIQDITERKRAEDLIRHMNDELERKVLARTAQLEAANQELEAFTYSVSHDLRAPLRGIDGFSQALLEDFGPQLGPEGLRFLQRIRSGTQRMGQLIDDLLKLSRVSRCELVCQPTDLSAMARRILEDLAQRESGRSVRWVVEEGLEAQVDPRLLQVVLENMLGNAWKFTSHVPEARIEFTLDRQPAGGTVYTIRDNGAGFDPAYTHKLFGAFQRLHSVEEFPGTGVGLATVKRILHRHGGRIWAEGLPGQGAVFRFTLP